MKLTYPSLPAGSLSNNHSEMSRNKINDLPDTSRKSSTGVSKIFTCLICSMLLIALATTITKK